MSGRTRAALFDLDDTIYPERTFVDSGFRAAARFLAPKVNSSADVIARRLRVLHDRDGRGHLFDDVLADLGVPADKDLVLATLVIYRSHRPRLRPFDGVVEGLDRLRSAGVRTGLVSDGLASVQRRKVASLPAIGRRLDAMVMTDELGPGQSKPSPVPFRVACRLLDVEPANAVYVANDPRKDFAGARAAGLRTIRTGLPPDEGVGPPSSRLTAAPVDDADSVASTFADAVDKVLRGTR